MARDLVLALSVLALLGVGWLSQTNAEQNPVDLRVAIETANLEQTMAPAVLSSSGPLMKTYRVDDVNGDGDGYADSNETIDLFVTLHNPSNWPSRTNVVVRIDTADPKIDCISTPTATIASMLPGTDADVAFRFHVHPDADRAGSGVTCSNPGPSGACSNFVQIPGGCLADGDCIRSANQDYAALLIVAITSDQAPAPRFPPQTIVMDVDLNSNHSSGPTTTFAEGFESGFGSFTFQNIDENKATLAASDGYRCPYNDPDNPNSNSYDNPDCYMGSFSQTPVNAWHVHGTGRPDGGRAFSGIYSLHYGVHPSLDPSLDTYQLSQLDAIRTKSGVNLAARVCRNDAAANPRACSSAADCVAVGGGPCVSASPELSFKQQVSLVDNRGFGGLEAADRAVVHAQVGTSGVWQKLVPFENTYDIQGTTQFINCLFDPIDDGNDEESFYDPEIPVPAPEWGDGPLGPSSTCFPEFVFTYLGDTDELFNPANIGRASDGPGLQGALGPGTWVNSRIDLSSFRGRSIRIRFVVTSLGADHGTWGLWGALAPIDDGWYLDDVRVTQTLGAAVPTVALDGADNDALPGNEDGDARGDECDCAPADPAVFAMPSQVETLVFASDKITLLWESASTNAGSATVHDVLSGALEELPVGSGPFERCVASGIQTAQVSDPAVPASGRAFWYVVRGRNACGRGTYGFGSGGVERTSSTCP